MLFSPPQNPESVITLRDEQAFVSSFLPDRSYKPADRKHCLL